MREPCAAVMTLCDWRVGSNLCIYFSGKHVEGLDQTIVFWNPFIFYLGFAYLQYS